MTVRLLPIIPVLKKMNQHKTLPDTDDWDAIQISEATTKEEAEQFAFIVFI